VNPLKKLKTTNEIRKMRAQVRRERLQEQIPLTPRDQRKRVQRRAILFVYLGIVAYLATRILFDAEILLAVLVSATVFVLLMALGLPKVKNQ
jgi:cytochrome c-type biogenesis protein CcmH/NrfG